MSSPQEYDLIDWLIVYVWFGQEPDLALMSSPQEYDLIDWLIVYVWFGQEPDLAPDELPPGVWPAQDLPHHQGEPQHDHSEILIGIEA